MDKIILFLTKLLPAWHLKPKPYTVSPQVIEAIKVTGKADYTYNNPNAIVKTDRSGDTYTEWSFSVLYRGAKLGQMTIWHNRYGAFAHFTETRSYPLG